MVNHKTYIGRYSARFVCASHHASLWRHSLYLGAYQVALAGPLLTSHFGGHMRHSSLVTNCLIQAHVQWPYGECMQVSFGGIRLWPSLPLPWHQTSPQSAGTCSVCKYLWKIIFMIGANLSLGSFTRHGFSLPCLVILSGLGILQVRVVQKRRYGYLM